MLTTGLGHPLFQLSRQRIVDPRVAALGADQGRNLRHQHDAEFQIHCERSGTQRYDRALRSGETNTSAAGPVTVMRTLYRRGREAAVVPLEWRAGIVADQFTPRAARQGLWAVAHLTPQEAEGMFREVGNMSPSKSNLDRLPKACSAQWEARRQEFEAQLRETLRIPATAVTLALSLDGVMTPMKDGSRSAKREAALADGKRTKGPAGYQEVGCATLSFYDAEGARLSTLRMARMP